MVPEIQSGIPPQRLLLPKPRLCHGFIKLRGSSCGPPAICRVTGEFQRRQRSFLGHAHPHGGQDPRKPLSFPPATLITNIVRMEGGVRLDHTSGTLTHLPHIYQFEIYMIWTGGFTPAKKGKSLPREKENMVMRCNATRSGRSKGLCLLRSPDDAVRADISKLLLGAEHFRSASHFPPLRMYGSFGDAVMASWGCGCCHHGAKAHTNHMDMASESGTRALQLAEVTWIFDARSQRDFPHVTQELREGPCSDPIPLAQPVYLREHLILRSE